MAKTVTKKMSFGKKILIAVIALIIIGGGIYWYIATEKFSATKDRKAAFTVDAIDLIKEFRKNDSSANQKYREQIITVSGIVSELESPDTATVNIKFIDTATGDYAIFAFQEQYLNEAKAVKVGERVSIKGSCSGSSFSEILETYFIPFKRSTIVK